jgi:hypothetical protein
MRLLLSSILFAALGFSAVPAKAGFAGQYALEISTVNRRAGGGLNRVRASNNPNAYIDCSLDSSGSLWCSAWDGTVFVYCYTQNPAFFPAAQMLYPASHLVFEWNASGECTRVTADNMSQYLPGSGGSRDTQTVFVDDRDELLAMGSMSGARGSANKVEYIGCRLDEYASGPTVWCNAHDRGVKVAACHSSDPALVTAAQMINETSLIQFMWDPSTHLCIELLVANDTSNLP